MVRPVSSLAWAPPAERRVWPRLAALMLGGGLVAGLLPPVIGAPVVLGAIVLVVGVVYPRLPLYLLGLAAPLASVREIRVGGIGLSPTEGLVGLALVAYGLA